MVVVVGSVVVVVGSVVVVVGSEERADGLHALSQNAQKDENRNSPRTPMTNVLR